MSFPPQQPFIVLFLGLGIILLVLCGVITWTTRTSIRLGKKELPKIKFLFAIAFLQVLLGVITIFVVRAIKDDPVIAIGTGAGIMFLSGLFYIKVILKKSWRQSLRIWAVAFAMQLVLVPVFTVVMVVGWIMILLWMYPPQF
jgi:hypothetical protein